MPMTLKDLNRVRAEMERLLDRIIELEAAQEVAVEEERREGGYVPKPLEGSAFSGAVKRASMDLSRALAELRKPS